MMKIKSVLPGEFESQVDKWIGDYSSVLKEKTYTDGSGEASHLDAIKYTAAIVWNYYKEHDENASIDVVYPIAEAACLTMHPQKEITKLYLKDGVYNFDDPAYQTLVDKVQKSLFEVQKFKDLILLEDNYMEAQSWVKVATSDKMSESLHAQMLLVSWFLCLVSKMTGKIPGNKNLQVGSRIMKEREYVVRYCTTATIITKAMFEKNKSPIMKEMLKDLNQMKSEF